MGDNTCRDCKYFKFRTVSMSYNIKDAGAQCHHPSFKNDPNGKGFRKIEEPQNGIPSWCPF